MYAFIGVFSAEHHYDNHHAAHIRDVLKEGGVRANLGPSCYVAHRSVQVHALDLLKASKVLIAYGPDRDSLWRYIARCCREKFSDNKDFIRRLRRELAKKDARAKSRKGKRKAS